MTVTDSLTFSALSTLLSLALAGCITDRDIGDGADTEGGGGSSASDSTASPTAASTSTEASEGDSNSSQTSTSAGTTSRESSGEENTGAPPAVCGGECFADAVASAYNTCQSDLDDYPCEAPRPCPTAVVQCDIEGENCVFEEGDAQTYVAAVACVFDAILAASPGRYSLRYGQESEDAKLGTEWDSLNADVHADGSAQMFHTFPAPFEGGLYIILSDVDLSCVRDQLTGVEDPTDFAQAVSSLVILSGAINTCSELCLQVFEGVVQFPDDLPCE